MAIRRVLEILEVFNPENDFNNGLVSSWTAVFISVIMLLSLVFIKRIFNIQQQIDKLRKQNEAQVLSAILKTEENERQHFAKELHDGLGPLLSSVKMAISASVYIENENKAVMLNAEKLIDESIRSLKDISNNLSPHVLINFGLHKALKSFMNRLQTISDPMLKLNSNIGDKRFSFNIEVVLYRVICELLSNTLKHANAHNVYIDLMADQKTIRLKYIDDGIGFDVNLEEKKLTGLGYSNMKSRIRSLNGTYKIFSEPNEGIRVDIIISLESHE